MDGIASLDDLRTYFGEISEEEYFVLLDEYGEKEGGMVPLIYEAMDEVSSISELVSKLKLSLNETPAEEAPVEDEPIPIEAMPAVPTVLRHPPGMDASRVRSYLSEFLENPTMKQFLQELSEKQQSPAASSSGPGVLILMRGASGSGKSTLATVIWSINTKAKICSADKYFINAQGEYVFNKNSLGKAHDSCRDDCRRFLARGDSPIIIDNTNTLIDHMIPYVDLAIEFNYDVKILEPITDWKNNPEQLARESEHEVPKHRIEAQLRSFEQITEKDLLNKVLKKHKNKAKYRRDRGWGLRDAASEQSEKKSLEKLQKWFRFEARSELENKLKENNGDLDKTVLQLIEAGKAMVTEDELKAERIMFTSPPLSVPLEVNPVPGFSGACAGGSVNSLANQKLFSNFLQSQNENVIDDNKVNNNEESFEMILPRQFAKLLIRTYGHAEDEARELKSDLLTIKLSSDTAFTLFTELYKNLHKAETEARRVEEENRSPNAGVIEAAAATGETQGSHEELLGELEVIDASLLSTLRPYTGPYRTLDQTKAFLLIKQEYPHVDPLDVDGVFTQCFLDIKKTREVLNQLHPAGAAGGIVAGPSSASAGWTLKYNPKNVSYYTPEQIKEMEDKCEKLIQDFRKIAGKIKYFNTRRESTEDPLAEGHYLREIQKLKEQIQPIGDEIQYSKAVLINAKAKEKNEDNLDLHTLSEKGALRVLEEFLEYKIEQFFNSGKDKLILLVITGRGKHSKDGVGVLHPAVGKYLADHKYRHYAPNPGCYHVVLTQTISNKAASDMDRDRDIDMQ